MTPTRHFHRHVFGICGIWLPGENPWAGNYPRIPSITLGLGLVHYPLLFATHRYTLLGQSSRSAPPSRRAAAERRTTCPSSDSSTYVRDGPCSKDRRDYSHRGRPHEKVPLPASPKAPSHQQRCGVTIDGPMQFAFADPLVLPASGTTRCSSQNRFCRGLPTLRQAAGQTLR
jgi:hypothetical protein